MSGSILADAARRLGGLLWLRASLAGLWLAAGPMLPAAPGVSASLDRGTISMGETLTLNLTFDGMQPPGEPNLPPLPSLTVVGKSQSSQISFENGVQTARKVYAFILSPTQPGDVVIPAMQLTAGGRAYTTQPLPLKILPGSATPTNLAFLKLIVPKTEVYVGEPVEVEMQLYVQQAEGVKLPQLKSEGFTISKQAEPQQTRTQIGGVVYNLVVFKLAAIPARTGALTLGPAEESLTLLVPVNTPRGRDPFASFFGPQARRQPTTLTSEAVAMRVLPLPSQNVPADFSGAVGSYRLNVSIGPTNVAVGDPITVRAQITGRGQLEALALPEQSAWREFKMYPPNTRVETSDPLGLTGSKHFEQVVIPENHEIKFLPPLRFSFFNPATRGYQTLTNRPVALTVRPAGVAATLIPAATNASGAVNATPQDELVHIKPRLGAAARPVPLLAAQPWFLALQGVPPLAWIALRLWRRRAESLANNPRLRRQREAARRVQEGLKELPRLAAEQDAAAFFAALFRVLQEQLGERLDLPASAITEAVIDERLRPRQAPEPLLRELHELFQACNLARYAPRQSTQELSALIPRLETVLRALQRLPA